MTQAITVVLACENEIFARGISASLRENPSITVRDFRDGSDKEAPDVAIVSPQYLEEEDWTCPVLVCTDKPFDTAMIDRPLAGILPRRQLTPNQLESAVMAAAAGLRVGLQPPRPTDFDGRTVEVLRLIADGAGTREISDELGYSERTIKSVIAEAVRDLGARNRAHAVAVAMRRALI